MTYWLTSPVSKRNSLMPESDDKRRNSVGPVLRAGEVADAMVEAIQEDNPDKEFLIEDRIAYVRVETEGECVIRQETLSQALGRPITMPEVEVNLTSFAGRIETTDSHMRFYLEKSL